MNTAAAKPVAEGDSVGHEALPLDAAERAEIHKRIGSMVWAGERAAIRTRIGSMIWAGTTVDEAAAGDLADRILDFIETRLPERRGR